MRDYCPRHVPDGLRVSYRPVRRFGPIGPKMVDDAIGFAATAAISLPALVAYRAPGPDPSQFPHHGRGHTYSHIERHVCARDEFRDGVFNVRQQRVRIRRFEQQTLNDLSRDRLAIVVVGARTVQLLIFVRRHHMNRIALCRRGLYPLLRCRPLRFKGPHYRVSSGIRARVNILTSH